MKLIIKIGSNSLNRPEGGLDAARIGALAQEMSALLKKGHSLLLVTSGAIGAGMDAFGWAERPKELRNKQAAAAVGQVVLMDAYRKAFGERGVTVAQMLLSRSDLEDRERYLNSRNTLSALWGHGVIPILNENDTVATEEIQFGDNDSLAALIAGKMAADKLFLLTDVEGLKTSPGGEGKLLPEVFQITPEIESLVKRGAGSKKSVGGMASKIQAARLAMVSGVEVWIASGQRPGVITEILAGRGVGTRFEARPNAVNARKRWLAFGRRIKGTLVLDDGAVKALVEGKKSLLPSGITGVEGSFAAGDTVRLADGAGREFARGVAAFSSGELARIRGKRSADLAALLGRKASPEAVHRDNLVVLP